MKTATVRELRTEFPRLEALLFDGETIAITKHKRTVAKLVPVDVPLKRPDFRARFGGSVPAGGKRERSAVGLLSEDRGE